MASSRRKTNKRAVAPRRDMATLLARQDVINKYGLNFKYYDTFGIPKKISLRKGTKIKAGEIEAYFNKRYNFHYKK